MLLLALPLCLLFVLLLLLVVVLPFVMGSMQIRSQKQYGIKELSSRVDHQRGKGWPHDLHDPTVNTQTCSQLDPTVKWQQVQCTTPWSR